MCHAGVINVPADVVAPLGAWAFAAAVTTQFRSCKCTGPDGCYRSMDALLTSFEQ